MKTAIVTSILLLAASACGSDAPCIAVPCAIPIAVRIAVQESGSTNPITNASVSFTGPYAGSGPCGTALCVVSGGPGTYEIDVSAPGYQPAHRRVVVAGKEAKGCGCASAETQQVTVTLTKAG